MEDEEMTEITGSRHRINLAPLSRAFPRAMSALLDADRRHREATRLRSLPAERLEDIGLSRPADRGAPPAPFLPPAW